MMAAWLGSAAAPGQAPIGSDVSTAAAKTEPAVERKSSSWFHRPKKDTPAEQLAYADSLRDAGRDSRAASQYSALVHEWHESPEAPRAQFEYAKLLEKQGDYAEAFDEYEYLIRNFVSGFSFNEVVDRQYRVANAIMSTPGRFLWIIETAPDYEKALPLFEKIVANAPRWSQTCQAQYDIAQIHERKGELDEAISAYEIVQQNFPRDALAVDAAFRQGECLARLARENPREERRSQAARTLLQRVLREHPNAHEAAQARQWLQEVVARLAAMAYERAQFYDRRSGNPKAAAIAYRDFLNKFPDDHRAAAARARLETLRTAETAQPGATNPVGSVRSAEGS